MEDLPGWSEGFSMAVQGEEEEEDDDDDDDEVIEDTYHSLRRHIL